MQKIIQKSYIESDGKIKAGLLREEVKAVLVDFQAQADYLLSGHFKQFWELLHHQIVRMDFESDKEAYLEIEAQLTTLPLFIETWRRTAVETEEHFNMFVMMKASEIRSGNKDGDYFWALAIRHDQLIGLCRVIEALLANVQRWVKMKPAEVVNDGVFWGISKYNVEKQIYLESEKVHQERLNGKFNQ